VSRLLGTSESAVTSPWVYAASLLALAVGFLPAYCLFVRRIPEPSQLLQRHRWISTIQNVLIEGYGFDPLYERAFATPVMKLGSAIRTIQTGILGKNMWGILIFLLVVALVVLAI